MVTVFFNVIRTENFFSLWKGVSPVSHSPCLFSTFAKMSAVRNAAAACMHIFSAQWGYFCLTGIVASDTPVFHSFNPNDCVILIQCLLYEMCLPLRLSDSHLSAASLVWASTSAPSTPWSSTISWTEHPMLAKRFCLERVPELWLVSACCHLRSLKHALRWANTFAYPMWPKVLQWDQCRPSVQV